MPTPLTNTGTGASDALYPWMRDAERILLEGPAPDGPRLRAAQTKTGGRIGSIVAVVWVGLDDNGTLRLPGSAAAAPIWRAFMERAAPLRPAMDHGRPSKIVELWIETETGLLMPRDRDGAKLDLFRKGATPPKRRLLKQDEPIPIIE